MTDAEKREKIIEGMQKCAALHQGFICESCEYPGDDCAIDDAIALLKAQEPREPTLDIRHGKSMWRCGSCSTALQPNQINAKFCFNCGRAVKWDV